MVSRARVVLVSRVQRNPYVSLLCDALAQEGLHLRPEVTDHISLGWMWSQRDIAVLHLHWLELFIVYPSWVRSLKRFLSVMAALVLARLRGSRVVYTVHNLAQHEGNRRHLVMLATRCMLALADAVHVHDKSTSVELARGWGRRRGVYIVPHPSYEGVYPDVVTRDEARRALGLASTDFVLLSLGRLRPYKGLEALVKAFGQWDDSDTVLLIAGEPQSRAYGTAVEALCRDQRGIRLVPRYIANDELQLYLRAADVSVLSYEHVTTSGAALLSFSFGVPIIAPDIGCFRELVDEGERGMLYARVQAHEAASRYVAPTLLDALRRARSLDLARMRKACETLAADRSWKRLARGHADAYRRCEIG